MFQLIRGVTISKIQSLFLAMLVLSTFLGSAAAYATKSCTGIFALRLAERAIYDRLHSIENNQKIEWIAETEDLKVFKIPYQGDIAQLHLKPWIQKIELSKKSSKSFLDHINRNKLLLVNDGKKRRHLLLALHKSTSELFNVSLSQLPKEHYQKDVEDSFEHFFRAISGTGGFSGPETLLHLWLLRTVLKAPGADHLIETLVSWPNWKAAIKHYREHIVSRIKQDAFTGRYDLRQDFYLTIDQITSALASKQGIPHYSLKGLMFEPNFTVIENQRVRVMTWNLQNFYHPLVKKNLMRGRNSEEINISFKTREELLQIKRNIEILKPQVILVTEAELLSTRTFAEKELGGKYEVVGKNGNDPFLKNILLLVRKDLPVYAKAQSNKRLRSNDPNASRKPIFTRDLPIFTFYSKTTDAVKLVVVGAHLKANQLFGSPSDHQYNQSRRLVEIRAAQVIIRDLQKKYGDRVILAGDFNTDIFSPTADVTPLFSGSQMTNTMASDVTAYSILSKAVHFGDVLKGVIKSYPYASPAEQRNLADIQYEKSSKFAMGVLDGIFVHRDIKNRVIRSGIHRLVDKDGIVIPPEQHEKRASDHNIVYLDLDMGFLKP